ncbi:GDSL-type esterase/lipase family protein [Fictibacillus enclensis]|uniref:SGNH/GDSL hydrolase family protein n=1 Tax=Fictibacillus enclensis TaxID=1017270 RepID=UPI0025A0E2E8|nr:GDSL-type esterase/lipase family protein [Fictibacillus enclensis]MDM5340332.1 GDSL-type esterase/lipase family protein [Fictibacillus enclensis]
MKTMQRPKVISPGFFGSVIAADSRRTVFDFHNEVLIAKQAHIDFLFIGDSITEMWDTETYFGGKGNRIVNRGIGGDTTTYMLKRFDADCVQLKPKYAVMKIGINNLWALDAPVRGERKDQTKLLAEVVSDIAEMVRKAKDGGIIPVVCSLLPTNIETNLQTCIRNELVLKINEQLKELVQNEDIPYVNYHPHLTEPDGKTLRPELADDGLHPHVLGYDIMAEVLREDLKKQGITI